jgi:hypothetical protein
MTMQNTKTDTRNWPDLAIGLYDRLTGRGAEISYEMQNLEVQVPSSTGPDADWAKWVINGAVKITTRDQATS